MFTRACTFWLQTVNSLLIQLQKVNTVNITVIKSVESLFAEYNIQLKRKMSNDKWRPNGLCSENGLEINSVWLRVIMNFEMWIMYVSWNLPASPVLSRSRFSSNVKTISAAEEGISSHYNHSSFLQFWNALGLKIALILLLRHFWTLNF